MSYHPLANKLNQTLKEKSPEVFNVLSSYGKRLFFPRGIVTQSQEAQELAVEGLNATIGIATENQEPMHLKCVNSSFSSELKADELYPYAPTAGLKNLRELWKTKIKKNNPSLSNSLFTTPIVVNAITHGLSIAGEVFSDPEDEIIMPNLFWGNYNMIYKVKLRLNLNTFQLFDEELSHFNIEAFSAALANSDNKKKLVLLNFPNNPTGYTPTKAEAKLIKEALIREAEKGTNLVVICDDAYFGLTYESGLEEESFFASLTNIHERIIAVKLDGFTKEAFAWGLRVGFITVSNKNLDKTTAEAIEKKIAGAIRGSISSTSHTSQTVLLKALKDKSFEEELNEKKKILNYRYKKTKELVFSDLYKKNIWKTYPFNSGYFMCLKVPVNSEDLRKHLLEKYGLGTISIDTHNLRIAFSCIEDKNLPKVFDFVAKGVLDIKKRIK